MVRIEMQLEVLGIGQGSQRVMILCWKSSGVSSGLGEW